MSGTNRTERAERLLASLGLPFNERSVERVVGEFDAVEKETMRAIADWAQWHLVRVSKRVQEQIEAGAWRGTRR